MSLSSKASRRPSEMPPEPDQLEDENRSSGPDPSGSHSNNGGEVGSDAPYSDKINDLEMLALDDIEDLLGEEDRLLSGEDIDEARLTLAEDELADLAGQDTLDQPRA